MAKMFRISPFRLSTFRRCRRQYKYRYVERLPAAPNAPDTMGAHVHAALRDLMAQPPEERSAARAADLLRTLWATNRAGFAGLAEEARWRARALEQVQNFTRTPFVGGSPVALERYLEVDVADGVRVVGRVDRIDERDDGALHIIDYKTGRPPDAAKVDPEQLRIYAMMVQRHDGRPVGEASFLYLDDGSAWSTQPSETDLEASAGAVVEAVDELMREREYAPNVGRHCAFCDFQRICPKRDEIVGRRLAEGW